MLWLYKLVRKELSRKERSERRVFALFHFVCILFLYLYCVSIDFCATERRIFCLNPPPPPKAISKIPIFQNSNFPKFQFSKIPIFQNSNFPKKPKKPKTPKKPIVPGLCLTPSSPHGLCRIGFFVFFGFFGFFGKLEFWKIGILYFLISWDVLNFQFPWK